MDLSISPSRWRRRGYRWAAIGFGVIALGLFALFMLRGAGERRLVTSRDAVTIATAGRAPFRDIVPIHGTIEPRDTILLDAVAGGQVRRLFVRPGDRVTAGQPLLEFRNAQLELDVLNNAGRLVESITQIQSFETQLENNRATNAKTLAEIGYNIIALEHRAARIDPLTARGFYTRRDAEALHDELDHYRRIRALQTATNARQDDLRRDQLPRLRSEQASLRRSLGATHAQLGDLIVRAPVTGIVTRFDLKIGQNRNRGERLAEMSADGGFLIAADLDEYYLPRVRVGQRATLRLGARTLSARVMRVHPEVTNGAFTVELDFGGTAAALVAGAAVEGELALGSDRSAIVLPAGAFLGGAGDALFVLDAAGDVARRRTVRLGRRTPAQVEVLGGLAPGERVIVSDYSTYARIDRIDLTP